MRLFNLLILVLICSFNYTNLKCLTDGETVVSASECHGKDFSSSEQSNGAYRCCYVVMEGKNIQTGTPFSISLCYPVTEYQYDNLDDLMDNDEKILDEADFEYEEFDCKSNYISSALVLLLIIFL